MVEQKKEDFTFDSKTVLFMMYILYKCNLITRHNIRSMIKIINEPIPGDIARYLVEEERKST